MGRFGKTRIGLLTGLQEMGDRVEEPARLLGVALVDVIAFGCTGGSFLNGPGYDREIAAGAGGAYARRVVDLFLMRMAAMTPSRRCPSVGDVRVSDDLPNVPILALEVEPAPLMPEIDLAVRPRARPASKWDALVLDTL